jgi:hypothetical protein
MKIPPELMSAAVKDFKKYGLINASYLLRKYQISLEMAIMIRDAIEKRFPNLWKQGKTKYGLD